MIVTIYLATTILCSNHIGMHMFNFYALEVDRKQKMLIKRCVNHKVFTKIGAAKFRKWTIL